MSEAGDVGLVQPGSEALSMLKSTIHSLTGAPISASSRSHQARTTFVGTSDGTGERWIGDGHAKAIPVKIDYMQTDLRPGRRRKLGPGSARPRPRSSSNQGNHQPELVQRAPAPDSALVHSGSAMRSARAAVNDRP